MTIRITIEVQTPEEAHELLNRIDSSSSAPSKPTVASAPNTSSESTGSPSTDSTSSDLLISAAVQKFADENGVDVTAVEGTGKDGRITKTDVKKAIAAAPEPEPGTDEPDPFGDDDSDDDFDDPFGDEEEAPPTKEGVRNALQTYQIKLKEKGISKGRDEGEAGKIAQDTARKLLRKVGGVDNLAALPESKYGTVIERAQAAIAKL